MNRSIKERKAAGSCLKRKCENCKYCFISPLLGIACGKEYPASYALACRVDDDDIDRDYGY